jgi:hypothetical protein
MPTAQRKDIIRAVQTCVSTLKSTFETEPTRFFTENDVVCVFHRLVHEALSVLGLGTVKDREGNPHSLVHCEFPTPFRCDMREGKFGAKADDDRTPSGGKYSRGHFDVVVLDPAFVAGHTYQVIKAQDYEGFCSAVQSDLDGADPVVLYGVEFVFCRDEIKRSRGLDPDRAANAFVAEVRQDADKLAEARRRPGFMRDGVMLAFVKGSSGPVMEVIRRQLDAMPGVDLCATR